MTAINHTAAQKGNPHYLMAITNVFLSTPLRQKSELTYKDFTMVGILAEDSNAIQVNAASPYKSFADLITAAKARRKGVSLGVGSIGGTDHMIGHRFGEAIGAEFNYVSFDGGGAAAVALMGGHVDFITGGPSETRGQIDAGRLRVLAVVGDRRLRSFPDVPTLQELGTNIGATFAVVRGFVAPPGVSNDAVRYYSDMLEKISKTPEWQEFLLKGDFIETKIGPREMMPFLAKRNDDIAETLTAMGVLK
jgi:putative tricarboxylic transport membrane protein